LTAKRERSRHDKDNGGEFKLLIMAGLPKQIKMSLCLFCGILSVALKAQYSSALVLWFYSANWSQTLISTQQLHFCECVCVCVCVSLSLSLSSFKTPKITIYAKVIRVKANNLLLVD
jgi:hypothetical protein